MISKYDEAAKLYYAALNKTKRKSDRKNLFEQLRQVNLSKMSMSNKYKALRALNTVAPIYIADLCDKIKGYMSMHDDFWYLLGEFAFLNKAGLIPALLL